MAFAEIRPFDWQLVECADMQSTCLEATMRIFNRRHPPGLTGQMQTESSAVNVEMPQIETQNLLGFDRPDVGAGQLTSSTPPAAALRPTLMRRRPCEDCLAAGCCAERAAELRAADGLGLPQHMLPPLRPAVWRVRAGNLRARLLKERPPSAHVPAS